MAAMATLRRPLALLAFVISFLLLPLLSLHNAEATGQREFDYFKLSLLWPGTACQFAHHCCSSSACCRSIALPEFTIHGLWVDYNDGTWPACCSHIEFDISKVTSLLPTLEKYWPSLLCSSSSLCFGGEGLFWAHEWEKHGTCSYPVIPDEYSYFSTALDLYFKYNMTEVLNAAGILATNSEKYPLEDVVTTIKSGFGASPDLACKNGLLEELRLCFNKDLKPRDCTSESGVILNDMPNSVSSCPRYVTLPTYAPFVFPRQLLLTIFGSITRLEDIIGLADASNASTEA